MPWWNRRSMIRLLSECVMNGESSFVMFPELATFYPAKLTTMREEHLELELFPQRDQDVQTSSFCCVTFKHEFQPHFFMSSVGDFREGAGPRLPTLVVEFPTRIFAEKRRAAFRVPVSRESGLVARVSSPNGELWAPTVVNLSVTGILLAFSGDVPDLPTGTPLEVALMLDSCVVSLKSEVTRRDNDLYGLAFLDVFDATGLNPPPALRNMARILERKWFKEQFRRTAEHYGDPEPDCDRDDNPVDTFVITAPSGFD